MRIYSMTATFGKLSHETLELKPGLNILEAPNEWGKSTWCAFLMAMLYGIDTRQHTTKAALADKERYSPWSGEPMSGRIELSWNGKEITIERSTKGRIPFGEFRAYETATGIPVPELTAANCGQQLLGVERSVFARAGFIRLTDMPVTQDESLRRRLNNLVTTGDESGAGDTLGKQLKDLKNKCRYNRSGLLPQAEYEREQLREQLQQRLDLQEQAQHIRKRQTELEEQIHVLENHAAALRYDAAKQGVQRIQEAEASLAKLRQELQELEEICAAIPSQQDAELSLKTGQSLLQQRRELQTLQQTLPQPPVAPEIPQPFGTMTPEQACAAAKADLDQHKALESAKKQQTKPPAYYGVATAVLLVAMALCYFLLQINVPAIYIAIGAILVIGGIATFAATAARAKRTRQAQDALYEKYPGIRPDSWVALAEQYAQNHAHYQLAMEQHQLLCGEHQTKFAALDEAIRDFAGASGLEDALAQQEQFLQKHQLLAAKRRETENAQGHAVALQAVATTAPEPEFPDSLSYDAKETESLLANAHFEQRQLQLKLGQTIGQAESIGQEDVLKARLDSLNRRINRLEEYYRALELAQEALYQASTALQRRFAPRISKKSQEYFSRLTGGRYPRITLSDDLSVSTSAENENTLRGVQWRSDGTADQLYFALRLAVAAELTPDAPLILDDALIRFDDLRLKAALETLSEEAQQKQVILFTCQSRENTILTK